MTLEEYICDEICKFPDEVISQEELDEACTNCRVLELLNKDKEYYYKRGIADAEKIAKANTYGSND